MSESSRKRKRSCSSRKERLVHPHREEWLDVTLCHHIIERRHHTVHRDGIEGQPQYSVKSSKYKGNAWLIHSLGNLLDCRAEVRLVRQVLRLCAMCMWSGCVEMDGEGLTVVYSVLLYAVCRRYQYGSSE